MNVYQISIIYKIDDIKNNKLLYYNINNYRLKFDLTRKSTSIFTCLIKKKNICTKFYLICILEIVFCHRKMT